MDSANADCESYLVNCSSDSTIDDDGCVAVVVAAAVAAADDVASLPMISLAMPISHYSLDELDALEPLHANMQSSYF
jgi:hypothetical protein